MGKLIFMKEAKSTFEDRYRAAREARRRRRDQTDGQRSGKRGAWGKRVQRTNLDHTRDWRGAHFRGTVELLLVANSVEKLLESEDAMAMLEAKTFKRGKRE